jgi:CheY-like chemotaxis protein
MMPNTEQVTILLVEDDPGHARLIEKNLRRANIVNDLIVFNDGREAVNYLFSEGEYAGDECASPMLVLLDLNMPGLDGYQVLRHIKQDDRTRRIPVIILTTTDDAEEVTKCYELGCSVYITKPVAYDHFCEAVRQLGLFLSVITVPDGGQ